MTNFQAWILARLDDTGHDITALSDLLLSHQAWADEEGREPLDLPDLRKALIKKGHRIGRQGVHGIRIR